MRVALAQQNLVVGDLDGNVNKMLAAYRQAESEECDVIAFPELGVTSYPPEDLLLRPEFVRAAAQSLEKFAGHTGRCAAVIGFPQRDRYLYNAAALCAEGKVQGVYRKHHLPNYAVFDESRYFRASDRDGPLFVINGVYVALTVCEDIWIPTGPAVSQAEAGAQLIININASPYFARRIEDRERVLAEKSSDVEAPIAYVNLVGGQDELVFDGGSMVYGGNGKLLTRGKQFVEDLVVMDVPVSAPHHHDVDRGNPNAQQLPVVHVSDRREVAEDREVRVVDTLDPLPEIYEALLLGTRDYVFKNGFTDVLIGLSGGMDSALVATIAADALGPEHVTAVMMPSRYSSESSRMDAEQLVKNLGIHSQVVSIESLHSVATDALAPVIPVEGVTDENLQARLRGNILMALSNSTGALVLSTGNKSEYAVGYTTLHGDMTGGFAVLKDVTKTQVYELARERNKRSTVIPESILTKAPSAELRPNQTDQDTLPPYEVLDPILERYVEGDESVVELEAAGFDSEIVRKVARMVDKAEYKRRQAPPGPRVSPKAFGKDRRLPITNHWPG